MSESAVIRMLSERYTAPEYAFLPQVRNGTGWARTTRTADAIAMRLWPSRGLELHGFEVKVSRSDWLREKADPAKAEEIASRCDRWWVAVAEREIVAPAELPPGWGLLAPRGGKLVAIHEAEKIEQPGPIDRAFLGAILRRVVEDWRPASLVAVEAAALAKKQAPREAECARIAAEEAGRLQKRAERELSELKESLEAFTRESGIRIDRWDGGKIGRDLSRFLEARAAATLPDTLRQWAVTARRTCEALEAGAKALDALPALEELA